MTKAEAIALVIVGLVVIVIVAIVIVAAHQSGVTRWEESQKALRKTVAPATEAEGETTNWINLASFHDEIAAYRRERERRLAYQRERRHG